MKNMLNNNPVTSSREDFSPKGRHIYLVRILAFASGVINFTEKENAHFDLCHVCRLKVIHSLRKLSSQAEPAPLSKAA